MEIPIRCQDYREKRLRLIDRFRLTQLCRKVNSQLITVDPHLQSWIIDDHEPS